MKKILINANQSEEFRFATVENGELIEIDVQNALYKSKKTNIYKGIVGHYQSSLDSVFIDFGSEKHGFLPVSFVDFTLLGCSEEDVKENRVDPKEVFKKGRDILVQVEKDERDSKGAFLSMAFGIPGRNIVLLPNSAKARGVAKTLSGSDRSLSKEMSEKLNLPDSMGVILRTAAQGKPLDELQSEVDSLVALYLDILEAYKTAKPPSLLYEDDNEIYTFVRDNLNSEVDEVFIDDIDIFNKVKERMLHTMGSETDKLRHYQGKINLFNFFDIEVQVETIHKRALKLPSGGEIIFDPTEALTAIDVNSAKATGGSNIEETAYNTNIEAGNLIAKQLKLRDIGGLIVIDFIDMSQTTNQEKLYKHMLNITSKDYARVQAEPISKFGLMELTRQRMRPSLTDRSYQLCPTCMGARQVRSVESFAISALNLIEKNASTAFTSEVVAVVASDIAAYLLNEKSKELAMLREKFGRIFVISSHDNELHQIEIKRVEGTKKNSSLDYLEEQKELRHADKFSHEYTKKKNEGQKSLFSSDRLSKQRQGGKGIFSKFLSLLSGLFKKSNEKKVTGRANRQRRYRKKRRQTSGSSGSSGSTRRT